MNNYAKDNADISRYIKDMLESIYNSILDMKCEEATEYVSWLLTKTNMKLRPEIGKSYPVFKKGVYYINFGKNVGSEQDKDRPAVVLWGTKKSEIVIVVPISDEEKYANSTFWFHVPLSTGDTALVEQIRTVSKTRIRRPIRNSDGRIRELLEEELKKINEAIELLKFS